MSELRLFVGIVNLYVRFFLPIYSLYRLPGKDQQWHWTKDNDKAFWMVDNIITLDEVLTHYDPHLPLCLATLPSLNGLEECLRHIMPDERRTNRLYIRPTLLLSESQTSHKKRRKLWIVFVKESDCSLMFIKKICLFTTREPLIAMCGPKRGITVTTAVRLQRCAFSIAGNN